MFQPDNNPTHTTMPLPVWNEQIDERLLAGDIKTALQMVRVVLRQLPQHLASYCRVLEAAWQLRRWDEGEEWGGRLLRADPGNPMAWRALARAAEERGARSQARAIWQRAFESDPYERAIRQGLYRTSINVAAPLALNQACFATIQRRCEHWPRAAQIYAALVEANPGRSDFQINLLIAQWQSEARAEAYRLAQRLVHGERALLPPWVVIHALGDKNDKALAHRPLRTLDPDGEYMLTWYGVQADRGAPPAEEIMIKLTEQEAELKF
ncbi:MAG: hypothetical protein R3A44_05575 [Caldilineaceae bacterium]